MPIVPEVITTRVDDAVRGIRKAQTKIVERQLNNFRRSPEYQVVSTITNNTSSGDIDNASRRYQSTSLENLKKRKQRRRGGDAARLIQKVAIGDGSVRVIVPRSQQTNQEAYLSHVRQAAQEVVRVGKSAARNDELLVAGRRLINEIGGLKADVRKAENIAPALLEVAGFATLPLPFPGSAVLIGAGKELHKIVSSVVILDTNGPTLVSNTDGDFDRAYQALYKLKPTFVEQSARGGWERKTRPLKKRTGIWKNNFSIKAKREKATIRSVFYLSQTAQKFVSDERTHTIYQYAIAAVNARKRRRR